MKPLLAVLVLSLLSCSASAQQMVDGKGKTCTSVNARCYKLGGNAALCEPKRAQCLQTGTFYGNNYTITNLAKR